MKKKIAALFAAICSTFLTAGFSACDDISDRHDVTLDISNFNPVVVYNSEISYETIKFNHFENVNGIVVSGSVIDGAKDMVISGGETDTVGEHELVIACYDEQFTIPYTVKYQVDFIVDEKLYDRQLVLNAEEIKVPQAPTKKGYEFGYWSPEIPTVLTDNVTAVARYYNPALPMPVLEDIQVVYEPNMTLESITLPSNKYGAWVFEDATALVGGVGEKSFDVRFVPKTSELIERKATVKVTVTAKPVSFTVENTSFVYDGKSHFPTYTPSEDVSFEVLGKAETAAGTYSFTLMVTDRNYQGLYSGSYEIKKPDVTVTVEDATMKFGEKMPEIKYSVEGFDDVDLLGITAKKITVNAIGEYVLDVTVANQNVNATVVTGKLTVEKGDLAQVGDPVLSSDNEETPAVYENPISSVTLSGDYRGVWTWKDPTAIINSVDSFTATAVFTPNNSNYNVIERDLTITNLDKRTLEITIISSEYTYADKDYTIVYQIEEGKILQVDGVLTKKEAGSYDTVLSINDKYYKGTKNVTLIIHKATPVTDFTGTYSKEWNNFLTLADVALPNGYTWDAPETPLNELIGTEEFAATFTPEDTDNFECVSGKMKVNVYKAQGVLHGVKSLYVFDYEKDTTHKISGITSTPANGTIKFYVNGEEVTEFKDAGTYEVTVKLFESKYHTEKIETTTVRVNPFKNTDDVKEQWPDAVYYGTKLNSLKLPDNDFGEWSWEGATDDTTVGEVGSNPFVAVYTPYDTKNYESRNVTVSVTVIQLPITPEPSISTILPYTGEWYTVWEEDENAPYWVTGDLTAKYAGDYSITFTLKDPHNRKWQSVSGDTLVLTYTIKPGEVELGTLTTVNGLYNKIKPTASVSRTDNGAYAIEIKYYYDTDINGAFANELKDLPLNSKAGDYYVIARVADVANEYYGDETSPVLVKIEKDTPVVVFDEHYVRDWYEGIKLSSIRLEDGFTWKEDQILEVGEGQEFAVVYTPDDTTNFKTVNGTFKVTVRKLTASIGVSMTFDGVSTDKYEHTYSGGDFVLTATGTHTESEVVITVNGETITGNVVRLTNADSYEIIITLAESDHYNAATEWKETITINSKKANYSLPTWSPAVETTMGELKLPTVDDTISENDYKWEWRDKNGVAVDLDQLVGEPAETVEYQLHFISSDTNFESFYIDVEITVGKIIVSPTLEKDSFEYSDDGFTVTVTGAEDVSYTVDYSGVNFSKAGDYEVRLIMSATSFEKHEWSNGLDTISLPVEITLGQVELGTLTTVNGEYSKTAPTASVERTDNGAYAIEIKYYYDTDKNGTFENELKDLPLDSKAGDYYVIARVLGVEGKYEGTETLAVLVEIEKTDYTGTLLAKSYSDDWFSGITLAHFTGLPEGYSWTNPNTALVAGTTENYDVTYVDPSNNYNPAYGTFTVTVNKLSANIQVEMTFDGVSTDKYTHTYSGGDFVLTATGTHTESEPVITVNGETITGNVVRLTNADSYEIIITLAESDHYNAATEWKETITINSKKANYSLPTWSPAVETTMGELKLPTVDDTISKDDYKWEWRDKNGVAVDLDQLVGGPAETVDYQLHFISSDTNFASFYIPVSLTVGKIIVSPTLEKNSFKYADNGFTVKVLNVPTGVSYTVDYDGVDFNKAGDYEVRLIMSATSFKTHAWNGSNTDTVSLPVSITLGQVVLGTLTTVNGEYNTTRPTASVERTDNGAYAIEIKYYYDVDEDGEFANELKDIPLDSNAGDYYVIARVAGVAGKYEGTETLAVLVTIEKTDYTGTLLEKSYSDDWFSGITLAHFTGLPEGYSWTNPNTALVAGTTENYDVTYVDPSNNYNPAHGTFTVTVRKLTANIQVSMTFDGVSTDKYTHTYSGGDFVLTATGTHTESEVVITVNGEVITGNVVRLTNADSYEIIITLAESEHYNAATEWKKTITINPATDNDWLEGYEPSMSKDLWTFNDPTPGVASAKDKYGSTVIVEYKKQSEPETAYAQGQPTAADKYYVRFRVEGKGNYNDLTSDPIPFEIEAIELDVRIVTGYETFEFVNVDYFHTVKVEFLLNGELFAFDKYRLSNHVQSEASDDYELTVTITDTNYKFDNGTREKALPFSITPAQVTLGTVTTTNGKYDSHAPTASVERTDDGTYAIGEIVFYYDVDRNGNYENRLDTLTKNSPAGTYFVIAKVEDDENGNYLGYSTITSPVTVEILQAATPESYVKNSYTVNWREGLTLADIEPTGTAENGFTGSYEWIVENGTAEATELNVQTYTAFKVKFTPTGASKNYAPVTVDVTVIVNAIQVTAPTKANTSLTDGTNTTKGDPTYSGNAWTKSSDGTDDYVITATSSVTNAGEQITLTFTLKANREWKDGTTTAKTLTFTVQKAENNISSLTFENGKFNVTATYTGSESEEVEIKYYFDLDGDGEFTDETYPTTPGVPYDVQVVIAESANYAYAEKTFVGIYTVTQQTVSPTVQKDGVNYNNNAIYTGVGIRFIVVLNQNVSFTIACEDGCEMGCVIDGNEITVVNAGTYKFTLTLAESDLAGFKWAGKDAGVASTTITFTIKPAENGFAGGVSVEDLLDLATHTYDSSKNLFTRDYDGSESKVDLDAIDKWTKFGSPVITYHYATKDGGIGDELEEGEFPKNAGNYVIQISVAGNGNNYAAWSTSVSLTINQVETEISTLPTHPQGQYQNQFLENNSVSNDWGKTKEPVASVNGEPLPANAGTFIYGDITINNNSDGVTATYTLTFIPNDQNYEISEEEVTITFKSVAHVATVTEVKTGNTVTGGTLNSQIYYGTVEDALAAANKSSSKIEVWVIPDKTMNVKIYDTGMDGKKDNIIYVGENVTLILPFAVGANNYVSAWNSADSGRNPEGKDYTSAGREHTLAIQNSYLMSNIILASGVTLKVQGVMEIAGRLGGGEASKLYAGHTFGKYAQLTLEDGASVQIDGKLSLTGYIVGAKGKVIVNNGGKLYQPFVLNDHHGGSYMASVATSPKKAAPFNRYQFRNIEKTLLRINYGGEMYVYANMFANTSPSEDGSYNHAEALFIGVGAVIELTSENSYMTAIFTPAATRDDNNNYPYLLFHNDKTSIHIYGGAKMNQLQLTLLDATIESSNFDFPIPSFYDITLHSGDYKMENKVKLLPGAKLTVEEDAKLTAPKLSVYTFVHELLSNFGEHKFYDSVSAKTPARFTVNGSFTADTFGGIIYTNKSGATVTIVTATSSVNETSGKGLLSPEYQEYKHTLSLKKAGNMGGTFSTAGTYYSDGNGWYTTSYSISYDFNGGNETKNPISVTNGLNGYTVQAADLPTPTRTHYTFSHWCLTDGCTDENCGGVQVGDVLCGDTTLYAAWTANEYALQFINVLPDGSETATGIENIAFTVETTHALPATPTAPNVSYNFSGWFKADGTQIVSILGLDFASEALTNGVATVYAHWTGDVVYEVIFQTNNTYYPNSSTQAINSLTLPDLTEKNNDVTYEKFFDGWYVDSALTTAYTDWEQLKACEATGGVATQRTLYAKWTNKITITITSTDVASDSDGTYEASYTIKFSETNGGVVYFEESKENEKGSWLIIPGHYVYVGSTTTDKVTNIKKNTWTAISTSTTIEVNYDHTGESSGGCYTGDTLITLADGSQKRADQITLDDTLLVFNHETGEYETAGIIFIENDGMAEYNVINLTFSDGTKTKLIYEHGYFDLTLNKYVYITADNCAEFVGHEFAMLAEGTYKAVTLVDAYVEVEYTGCYSLVTVYHLNYFVDGLFSMPGGIEGLFNMFEYGEGLVYDEEQMQADIEEYGLYSYEDFAEYLPYEVYAAFPAPQLKVAVGKGMITFEEILGYIERYLVKNEVI